MDCYNYSSNHHVKHEDADCGTTFVETEHYRDDAMDGGASGENHLLTGLTNHRPRFSRYENHDGDDTRQQSNRESLTIDSLRDSLASDVIVDDDSGGVDGTGSTGTRSPYYTMITSPFERHGRDRRTTREESKYYRVPIVYCDQTASNRPLRSIERYIASNCLPYYGNTHTNTSLTGSQSTAYVGEARQIVAEVTNAKITGKASCDIVLFAGHGTTSVIELFIDIVNLKDMCRNCVLNQRPRPVVFIGPYEHHSNLIPWRETGCDIVMIPENAVTRNVDLEVLEEYLRQPKYDQCPMKIGTFTAASNVTGKLCPVDQIAALLHTYQALAVFDYATASSYTKIDMNPVRPASDTEQQDHAPTTTSVLSLSSSSLMAKDAVFISPHKMIGGVGTPGVLIMKKHLVSPSQAPSRSGGGTVFYVTQTHHRFLSNRIHRYEGGSPNVIGIIRAGLTFLLQRQMEHQYRAIVQKLDDPSSSSSQSSSSSITPNTIEEYDKATYRRAAHYLKDHAPNLVLLGYDDSCTEQNNNVPIFSFLIRFGQRFLHYNYVCAILNDVFGIQSRGGCQCAGPYSQKLLGLVDHQTDTPNLQNAEIEDALYRYKERAELLRPGYTRLCLPYKGLRNIEVDYVLKALVWISKHGWALMCQYRCNHRTGEWRHANRQGKPLGRHERKWLSHYTMSDKSTNDKLNDEFPPPKTLNGSTGEQILDETFANAESILLAAKSDQRSIVEAGKMTDADLMLGNDDGKLEQLRWYVYPKECADLLLKGTEPADQVERVDSTILGAIQPISICPPPLSDLNSSDRKRKSNSDSSNRVFDLPHVHIPNITGPTVLLSFRDGEHHAGEAAYDEICNGIEDGELSSSCEIFHPVKKEWTLFENFDCKSLSPLYAVNQSSHLVSVCHSTVIMSEEEGQQKKGVRTSANWGIRTDMTQSTRIVHADTDQVLQPDGVATVQKSLQVSSPTSTPSLSKKQKFRHVKPPAKLMRTATQAIVQWNMINDGDRLLLGLSGGKDSLSLLHLLLEFKRIRPIKFDIEVCTIDPMTPSFDPSPLIPYVESLGLTYHYIRDDIVSRANNAGKSGKMVSSLCAFCARMKRGNLYSCARKNSCNKLVLAQHLDDCAESMMMSMMHNGFLRTMKANYAIDAGDLSVIRPLIYCREGLMTAFAKDANLPVINENCPGTFGSFAHSVYPSFEVTHTTHLLSACFEEPKERARIKKMLSREETLYPNFYDNIRRSLIPLMHDDMAAILRAFTEEAISRSRKIPWKEKNGSHELPSDPNPTEATSNRSNVSLVGVSDDELVLELARRKVARQLKLSTNTERSENAIPDLTGQMCSLNGGNGSIPCYELME